MYTSKVKNLPQSYHQRLLGSDYSEIPQKILREAYKLYQEFSLEDSTDANEVVEIPLPEWLNTYGSALREAIHHANTVNPTSSLRSLSDIAEWEPLSVPSNFKAPVGWSVWLPDSQEWRKLRRPVDNRTMVLDFEAVQIDDKWYPLCAIARSAKGWLCWRNDLNTPSTLVSFGKGNFVHGWNISYDRQYLDVEYLFEDSSNRFSDGMSQWIVTRGISNQQIPGYKAVQDTGNYLPWTDETCGASLDSVYEFYFDEQLDKGVRTILIGKAKDESGLSGIDYARVNLEVVLEYCCKDVAATWSIHPKLYPEYCRHRPSCISKLGHIELGSCWLPMSVSRYPGYYDRVESMFQETLTEVHNELYKVIQAFVSVATEVYPVPVGCYSKDLSIRQVAYDTWVKSMPLAWQSLDWSPALSGKTKGLPEWYRKIGKKDITLHKRYVPIILGLQWQGQAIYWDGAWRTEENWLEHPDDKSQKVTDLFIKGYVKAFEDGIISGNSDVTPLVLKATMCINWVSSRKRVKAIHSENMQGYPVVLPQISPNGTITGRAADSLWQVLANPKEKRLGTELKSMIEAPEGYYIVGFDVDSEEMRLAALLGDADVGYVGTTPIGLMVAIGDKNTRTDVHSIVAQQLRVNRDAVKALVYGCIYGLGKAGATKGLMQELLTSYFECEVLAVQFLAVFKGQKSKHTGEYIGGLASRSFTVMERIADSKQPETSFLKNKLTKSLAGNREYKPTRTNWVIQSLGVDFRDTLVLLTKYFYYKLGVRGRLMMTIHDEIRTCVKSEDTIKAAYALQLAHLVTWTAIGDSLGLDSIPAGGAWASSVDIDKYLRKEPKYTCITPSQLEALPKGTGYTPKQLLAVLT